MTYGRGVDATDVVAAFNDRINARDLDGLTALMTDDHTFVDDAGAAISGRQACAEAWAGFFAAFPDYRNVFETMTAEGETVRVTGHSVCAEPDAGRAGRVDRHRPRGQGQPLAGDGSVGRAQGCAGRPRCRYSAGSRKLAISVTSPSRRMSVITAPSVNGPPSTDW